MWHAVGHEIMSPLQSLMVLHGSEGDPSEAFQSSTLAVHTVDVEGFLRNAEFDATVTIHNTGPHIAAELIHQIFEYGVSDPAESGTQGNRGQGLFVAKTYMAKMGGTIAARNEGDGVSLVLGLQRVVGA